MRFLDLQINGFGKFHDKSVSFEDGINIVYGKNEAGKSTLHTFIRCMLFGMESPRTRASRKDLYGKYLPWEGDSTFSGTLRLEHQGHIYRLQRVFQKDQAALHIFDETLGRDLEATQPLMDELLGGLTATAYDNTISIGQLKSATEGGMAAELKTYISNMNTSGSVALNIAKASAFLNSQKKDLEAQLTPEAARSYTSLLSEIKEIEKDIALPEYENRLPQFNRLRSDTRSEIEQKQAEKDEAARKAAKNRAALSENHFTDKDSIQKYRQQTEDILSDYRATKTAAEKKGPRILAGVFAAFSAILAICAVICAAAGSRISFIRRLGVSPLIFSAAATLFAIVFFAVAFAMYRRTVRLRREAALSGQALQEIFRRHLGDTDLSDQALEAFRQRMAEFERICSSAEEEEASVRTLTDQISLLTDKQNQCSEDIEKQQKVQWELEKKLELLSSYKNQLETLKSTLAENQRISQEISSIELALETMEELSETIRDSFGLYLNKAASDLIKGITGGIYYSMYIDENLNVFMNTRTKMVPVEQVSSGTMDQIYLALRLAAARLIQGERENMPLIFDDSFVLYDDERLKSALRWLSRSYDGQLIIFTCHQREAQMLTANQIPYHMISL